MQSTNCEDEKAQDDVAEAKQTELVIVNGDAFDGKDYVLIDKTPRRAHICCGCDTRNAILTADIISVCFYLMATISFSLIAGDRISYDDDQTQNVMDSLDGAKIGLTIFIFVVGLICNIIAICGAILFNKIAVTIGAIWFLFETIRNLCFYDFESAIIAAVFCYPHIVFYFELKNGVMTKEKYPNEKVCCDCCCSC